MVHPKFEYPEKGLDGAATADGVGLAVRRLGQKEPVFVTRFISQGTIEGRIHEVLETKRQLFAEMIERNGPPPALGLSEEDLFGLFGLPARPRRQAA
jgi:hypothetical protein